LLIGFLLFFAFGVNLFAQDPGDKSAVKVKATPNVAVEKLVILEPTQGRPRMVKPGESFYFMFRVDKLDMPKVEASLVSSLCERERVPLVAVAPPVAMQVNHWVMLLKAPELTKPGVYDLLIDLGIGYQRVPRSVRIIDAPKKRFRFVHLSNMNIGEPTAPDFDRRLIDEVNLLNPEFILATGDFMENATANGVDGWRRTKQFLAGFHAPGYILCGDHDDSESFSVHVAPSLVGTLDYGPYHFFFLMDTGYHPIEQDTLQLKALMNDLNTTQASMTFIVGNRDNLGVLDGLRAINKDPGPLFADGKVRYLIFGGSTDWDYTEYAKKLLEAKLTSVTYVRTGQSSTSTKNGGTGRSRYRVFDVNDGNVRCIYPGSDDGAKSQASVPVGFLHTFHHGPNDGTRTTERVTVLNNLNQSFPDCRVLLRLAGTDPAAVKVANGKIEQVMPLTDRQLLVLANVGLPEKASVSVLATTDSSEEARVQKLPIQAEMAAPGELHFKAGETSDGLRFLLADETLSLTLSNTSRAPVVAKPYVTLDGQSLIIQEQSQPQSSQPAAESTTAPSAKASGEGFTIAAGGSIKLAIKPALRAIRPGRYLVSVYLLNDPLQRLTVFPVQVVVSER